MNKAKFEIIDLGYLLAYILWGIGRHFYLLELGYLSIISLLCNFVLMLEICLKYKEHVRLRDWIKWLVFSLVIIGILSTW